MLKGDNQMVELEKKKITKAMTYVIKPIPHIDGEYVKALRNRLGLSQWLFAELMHVSIKTVEKWEQGKNPVTNGNAVAMVLFNNDPSLVETFIGVEEMPHIIVGEPIKAKYEEPVISELKLVKAK